MNSAPFRAAGSTSRPYRAHVFAGRQHGDDDLGICVACRGGGDDLHAVPGRRSRNAARRRTPEPARRPSRGWRPSAPPMLPRPISPMVAICVRLFFNPESQFKRADGAEMAVDDFRRHVPELVRSPGRIAVLVDDRRADALDEIMPGDARERDAVVLLEALLDALERRRRANVAQRDLERSRRHLLQACQRRRAPSASQARNRATISSTSLAP